MGEPFMGGMGEGVNPMLPLATAPAMRATFAAVALEVFV